MVYPWPGMRYLVLSLFFFSGALGLVYQVVWVRMLTHVFGTTAIAVGIVLAAFMSGLALGSWLLGKLADRRPNPLRFYAQLEVGIGLTALAAHLLLQQVTPVYLALHEFSGQSETLLAVMRFVLAFGLVMMPTFLMGATLPVLVKFMLRRLEAAGADLGTLYAVNTTGAVAGVVACGFLLIGAIGIHSTVYLAVAGNLLIGVAAYLGSRHVVPAFEHVPDDVRRAGDSDLPQLPATSVAWPLLLLALFLSGVASFAYEIYWSRSLVFLLGNSTYALSTMLTAFIAGIALGSFLSRLFIDRVRDRIALFGWIQIAIAASAAAALPLLFAVAEPQALRQTLGQAVGNVELLIAWRFGVALLVMLLPATLIGFTFPLIGRIGIADLGFAGERVGLVYAINTLGNVVGALLPGFVLLSWLGIQRGILLMAVLNLVIGLGFLIARLRYEAYLRWATPLAAASALVLLAQTPLDFQFPSENETSRHRTLFYRDGPSATTKVTLDPLNGAKEMAIDGIVIGGNTFTEYKQLLLAHLPKLLRDDVSTELSIGLGSGMLVGESLRHDRVDQVTSVEIEPSVVAGAAYFNDQNDAVLANPRLRIVIDDISNFLRTTTQRYQVISADEKTSLDYASNGFSYSSEYYDLLRRRLAPGGIVIQWVPANLPPGQYRMVLKTFSASFPQVLMGFFMPAHRESGYNTILIGAESELRLDSERIDRELSENASAFANLTRYGLTTSTSILAQFVATGDTIRRAVAEAELNTLAHPRYEFYSPRDYAVPLKKRVAANIRFVERLQRDGADDMRAILTLGGGDARARFDAAIAAEKAYLDGYRISLGPVNAGDIFARYDLALGLAPWNRNLRERIALHYTDIANAQRNPGARRLLLQRAKTARTFKPD